MAAAAAAPGASSSAFGGVRDALKERRVSCLTPAALEHEMDRQRTREEVRLRVEAEQDDRLIQEENAAAEQRDRARNAIETRLLDRARQEDEELLKVLATAQHAPPPPSMPRSSPPPSAPPSPAASTSPSPSAKASGPEPPIAIPAPAPATVPFQPPSSGEPLWAAPSAPTPPRLDGPWSGHDLYTPLATGAASNPTPMGRRAASRLFFGNSGSRAPLVPPPPPPPLRAEQGEAPLPVLSYDIRGATRHLARTMLGGPPQLLAVCSVRELRDVLRYASVKLERWPPSTLHELYRELAAQESLLFSRRVLEADASAGGAFVWRSEGLTHGGDGSGGGGAAPAAPATPAARHLSVDPMAAPVSCAHLLLKRRSLSVQIVRTAPNGATLELVRRVDASDVATPPMDGEGGDDEGVGDDATRRLLMRRLGTRVTDTELASRRAVELAARELGVDARRITERAWHACSAPDRVPYPQLDCERVHYVVTLEVEGLPHHRFACDLATAPPAAAAPHSLGALPKGSSRRGARLHRRSEWEWAPAVDLPSILRGESAQAAASSPSMAKQLPADASAATPDVAAIATIAPIAPLPLETPLPNPASLANSTSLPSLTGRITASRLQTLDSWAAVAELSAAGRFPVPKFGALALTSFRFSPTPELHSNFGATNHQRIDQIDEARTATRRRHRPWHSVRAA